MTRKTIPPSTETAVLLACGRRCALCFGLTGDLSQKSGQIAHIDQDSSNPAQSNLVFLCLEHHNEYDSVPRVTKGITEDEVREYRTRLEAAVAAGHHHRGSREPPRPAHAETPEIGVEVGAGATSGFRRNRTVFTIGVQNRSASRFYLSNVGFELTNGHLLVPLTDIQGQIQGGTVIEPGDGHTLGFPAAEILEKVREGSAQLRRAWAKDKAGRIYYSTEHLMQCAVTNASRFLAEIAP